MTAQPGWTGIVMRVVGLVGMGHHAVGERGVDRGAVSAEPTTVTGPPAAAVLADRTLRRPGRAGSSEPEIIAARLSSK